VVDRVRKLMDKSARTENRHEAEAFAQKAAELVAEHRIDPERLAQPAEGALEVMEIAIGRGAYVRARLALLMGIAAVNDVRVVFRSTPTGTIAMLAGFSDDLRMVEVMYTSLHQQAAAQMTEIRRGSGAATQRHRRAFLFGYADRIGELLADAAASVAATASPGGSSGAGGGSGGAAEVVLAVQARAQQVDEFAETAWGRVRSASRPKSVAPDGYDGGRAAADRADVGRTRLKGRAALGRGS